MSARKDVTGQRFGRLVALSSRSVNGQLFWLCQCDCGAQAEVRGAELRKRTRSCGCLWRERFVGSTRTHGLTDTPEHLAWMAMHTRCYNRNNVAYPNYGGRGIFICERWRDSFANFLADMGARPSKNHSIDRINNDGPYSPDNCRWATSREQVLNSRKPRFLAMNGESMCIEDWARRTGISGRTIVSRLSQGWTVHKTLTTPPRKLSNHFGVPKTARQNSTTL